MQISTCRSVLFFLLCLLCAGAGAQTLKTSFEDANVPNPPPGWTVTNTGTANWQSLEGNAYEGDKSMYLADSYNGDASDAWLFSPAYAFIKGGKYSISFYYKNQSNESNTLAITLGTDALPASQTEVIWQNTFTNNNYVKAQINYTATETGTKHIAFHCTTPVTYTYIYVDNFDAENVAVFAPASATVLGATTTTATARWNQTEGAVTYEYGVSKTPEPPAATSFTSDTTALLTGLTAATPYFFYVRTVGAGGDTSLWTTASFSTAYSPAGIPELACGTYYVNSFTGGYGLYNNTYCGTEANGKEFFHTFKPTVTANYNLVAYYSNTGQTTLFLYKDSAAGTGPDGWTCIGETQLYGSANYSFGTLEAGKTYYVMEKTVRPIGLGTEYAYWIDCYAPEPAYDSCQNAASIASTPYSDSCTGTTLTTVGATSETPGAYVTFTATDDIQLFRFTGFAYQSPAGANLRPGMNIEIYSAPCDEGTLVDNGLIDIQPGVPKDILSYKLQKGATYYVKLSPDDQVTDATFRLCIMQPGITAGKPGECANGVPYTINANTDGDNRQNWVPLTDKDYKLIAAVNAQGNTLNKTAASVFVNSGALRTDGNGLYYLDRSFTLSSARKAATGAKIRLYFTNAELDRLVAQPGSGVTTVADLRVVQSGDDCASNVLNAGADLVVPDASGDYGSVYKYVEFTAPNELSSFYLRGASSVLPVTLLRFTATGGNGTVVVNWAAAGEVNISRYTVERSADGSTFTAIGSIAANGTGAYSFTDAVPAAGTSYYRLRIVETTGSSSLSNVATVQNTLARYRIFPTPAHSTLTLETAGSEGKRLTVQVLDMQGRVLLQQAVSGAVTHLNVSALLPGVYSIKVMAGGTLWRQTFTKL